MPRLIFVKKKEIFFQFFMLEMSVEMSVCVCVCGEILHTIIIVWGW